MTNPDQIVSRTCLDFLTEFSEEFKGALALAPVEDNWAQELGLYRNSTALKTVFPLSVSAAGYHEFKGDMKYRSLFERQITMTVRRWQDGVRELADVIENGDFVDWAGEPSRMAAEWARLPNELVRDLLEDNLPIDFYRDPEFGTASARSLFASDHPYNVFNPGLGTFNNDFTGALTDIADGSLIEAVNEYFRTQVMGPNGKPLGLRFIGGGVFLISGDLENEFRRALEHDSLIRNIQEAGANVGGVTQNNIFQRTVSYRVSDELAQGGGVIYAIATNRPGLTPWAVQQGTPEEMVHDKTSAMYKSDLSVAINYVGKAGAAALLPHPIARITLS